MVLPVIPLRIRETYVHLMKLQVSLGLPGLCIRVTQNAELHVQYGSVGCNLVSRGFSMMAVFITGPCRLSITKVNEDYY
jgi:hypothetical protein